MTSFTTQKKIIPRILTLRRMKFLGGRQNVKTIKRTRNPVINSKQWIRQYSESVNRAMVNHISLFPFSSLANQYILQTPVQSNLRFFFFKINKGHLTLYCNYFEWILQFLGEISSSDVISCLNKVITRAFVATKPLTKNSVC